MHTQDSTECADAKDARIAELEARADLFESLFDAAVAAWTLDAQARASREATTRVRAYLAKLPRFGAGEWRSAFDCAGTLAKFVAGQVSPEPGDIRAALDVWNRRNSVPLLDAVIKQVIASALADPGVRRHAA